jgi:hypothetical protein
MGERAKHHIGVAPGRPRDDPLYRAPGIFGWCGAGERQRHGRWQRPLQCVGQIDRHIVSSDLPLCF